MSNFYTEPFVSAGEMEFPSEPYITAQPQNHTATGPEEYVLKVIAAGAVSYQWEVFDGVSWSTIAGATSDSLTITIDSSMNGWRYRVLVTGADGSTVVSKAAQIAVKGVQEYTLEGAIVTFNGPARITSLEVEINAVQDLHGQSSPYPAGGGKNKFNPDFTNTTVNGTTITKLSDGKVTTSGVPTMPFDFVLGHFTLSAGTYILNGAPANGGANKWRLQVTDYPVVNSLGQDNGSGVTFTLASDMEIAVRLQMYIGASSPLTFAPMIRLSSVTDSTFAPYENICPISGWDAVNVARTGKNLFDASRCEVGKWLNVSTGAVENTSANYALSDYILLKAGVSYIITNPRSSRRWFYDLDKNPVSLIANSTFTPPSDGFARFTILLAEVALDTVQLEIGSTATDYEPYNGTTYPITLPSTCYGGKLDVVSGSGENTYAYRTLTYADMSPSGQIIVIGTSTWDKPLLEGNAQNGLCDKLKTVSASSATGIRFGANNRTIYLYGLPTLFGVADATEAISYIQTNNITFDIVYPIIAESFALTPTEVSTVLGYNNIFADSGDITVTIIR